MCIGIPLQVETYEADRLCALCGDGERRERLDMRLLGTPPVGAWVLSFNGAARRVLADDEAQQIRAALRALEQVMRGDGEAVDTLFADLVGRTPQLPAHLRPLAAGADAGAASAVAAMNKEFK